MPPTSTSRTDAPETTLRAGEVVLGRYRIERHVANGGMGQVFAAYDLELEERIAVKTLHPKIAESPQAVERFRREIRLARQVTHPNVCRIYDFGTYHGDDGRAVLLLTMEYLEGETLASTLRRRGRLASREAAELVAQLCGGLEAAHDQGIVHRDFNSRNVFLIGPEGERRAVITDFGLARQVGCDSASTLTLGGDLLGTPAYMAPEQLEAGEITPATDLYALGVVIYEMLTGRLPFEGDTPISMAVQHLRNPPPAPRTLVPDLDPRWEALVLRCLEKHPAHRFASAAELRRALDGRRLASASLSSRRRWSLLAAAALLAALVAGAATLLERGDPAREPLAEAPAAAGPATEGPAADAPEADTAAGTATAAPGVEDAGAASGSAGFRDALAALRRYDFGGARARFERLIEREPEASLAHARLAEALLGVGDRRAAREASKRALDLADRLSQQEQLEIQAVYHRSHGDDARALGAYRELWEFHPGSLDHGLALAGLLLSQGEPREAMALVESLRRLPPPAREDVRLDLLEAEVAEALSELARQRQAAERAAERAEKAGLTTLEAHARLSLSRALMQTDSLASSFEEAGEARALFERAGDRAGFASALLAQGWVLFGQGEHERARRSFERSLEIYRSLDHAGGIAAGLDRLAAVYMRSGELAKARDTYLEAISYHDRAQYPWGLVRTRYNLGLALKLLGDLEGARESFEQARRFWRDTGSRRGEAIALNSLGTLDLQTGDLPAAALRFGEAEAIHTEIGDRSGATVPISNRAQTSLRLGHLAEAEERYRRARRLIEETGELGAKGHVLLGLTRVYLARDLGGDAGRTLSELARLPAHLRSDGGIDREAAALEVDLLRLRDRPAEAEARARDLLEAARAAAPGAERELLVLEARLELAESLLERGEARGAQAQLEEVATASPTEGAPAGTDLDPGFEPRRRLLEGRVALALGEHERAGGALHEALRLAEQRSFFELELRARLALCGLEAAARESCLAGLSSEAAEKGFARLARLAGEAQGETGAATPMK